MKKLGRVTTRAAYQGIDGSVDLRLHRMRLRCCRRTMDCVSKFYGGENSDGDERDGFSHDLDLRPRGWRKTGIAIRRAAKQHVEELRKMGADPRKIIVQEINCDD